MPASVRSATPTSDTVVEISGVLKRYQQRQRSEKLRDALTNLVRPKISTITALDGIDLSVRRGEILAYAGANGAGKSTTIKLLSGLLAPDAGSVRVFGMDPVRQRVPYVRRIGVVFGQRTDLWWDHPVGATFEWKRVVWEIPRERFDRMLAYVKELLGLDAFFQTLARELSLGQRMRADLGLALMHEPELLLLDEPTLGLDVLAKRRMLQSILDLNASRAMTVIVTSHDMPDLEQLASRVVMLHRGAIAFDGAFPALRATLGDRRRLVLTTDAAVAAPTLPGADLVSSTDGQHEYAFDAAQVPIAGLLAEASSLVPVLDVETHRDSIDEVVADLYESWLAR
ncbi:ABC transporter ATP-binding protein [Tenggerimyces flavus]|uniref:ATP-binding cassette domain-containing protein n=1 Tax=Tenggerimyces flavus TaxID=1708749 RepID=A0ABV7YGT6_9ACTN|nr:ATP-binding cassette domain-containing protein [Tenggerimyces flavus]MBM7784197.1 ABC-2 type transport system ATP-binding protein [Tenggerimyces flavus]